MITNQDKKALNQLAKPLNQYHLVNDDILGAGFQNVEPLSIEDRNVVSPIQVVSEVRSRNTDYLDSREINDINVDCRALAMLRDPSTTNPARNSRKSSKSNPCRRDRHDTVMEKLPDRSSNFTDDRNSSDDRFDGVGWTQQPKAWTWSNLHSRALRPDPTDEVQG